MSSRPSSIAGGLLLLSSTSALAANPFASPGANGVGQGMKVQPGRHAGSLATLVDDTLHLQADPGQTISLCTDQLAPVAGRVLVDGEWKAQAVAGQQDWHGARVKLYYFDDAGKRISGQTYQPQLAFRKGDGLWERFTQAVIVPEGATKARLCAELVGVDTGELWLKDMALVSMAGQSSAGAKNVLWILVDTLRADALGTYGNALPVSQRIDDLAANGVTYERAWTQYTWTVPSVISFFTSQFARTHGWNSTFDKVAAGEYTAMGDDVETLAQVLEGQGYVTAGHYANGLLKSGIGVGRGFLTWRHGNDEEVVKRSIEDIGLWDTDSGPNFLYAHLMTPHIPLRPTGAAQRAAGIDVDVPDGGFRYYEGDATKMPQGEYNDLFQSVYTATVFDADRYVGQLLTALEDAGHADDTIVVLTSDHGELLGEHNVLGHGSYVYEGLTSVPLIVRAPDRKAERVKDRVGRTIDIAPTVLDWLDLEKQQPPGWQGTSLFESAPGTVAVAERDYMVAFTTDGVYKTVENRDNQQLLHAFDLSTDPGEIADLAAAGGSKLDKLLKVAEKWRSTVREAGAKEIQARKVIPKSDKEKDEELEMLRALGYVD